MTKMRLWLHSSLQEYVCTSEVKSQKYNYGVLFRSHHAILFFIFDLVNYEVFIIINYSIFDSDFTEPFSKLKGCLMR